jgi:hypothetical protein
MITPVWKDLATRQAFLMREDLLLRETLPPFRSKIEHPWWVLGVRRLKNDWARNAAIETTAARPLP